MLELRRCRISASRLPQKTVPQAAFLMADREKDAYCDALTMLIEELMVQELLSKEKGNAILQTLSRCPEK
jgi:hypothetical protein